jgi:hypothetical protein
MHHAECTNGHLLDAARNFLASRQKPGEEAQLLRDLTGIGRYGDNEFAIADDFEARGGTPYSGKVYSAGRTVHDTPFTEVLTTGIERLYRDPSGFASQDPDYFNFMMRTLQGIE